MFIIIFMSHQHRNIRIHKTELRRPPPSARPALPLLHVCGEAVPPAILLHQLWESVYAPLFLSLMSPQLTGASTFLEVLLVSHLPFLQNCFSSRLWNFSSHFIWQLLIGFRPFSFFHFHIMFFISHLNWLDHAPVSFLSSRGPFHPSTVPAWLCQMMCKFFTVSRRKS